ncbi:MAG: T9SS type A sorting domain-containing protein [Taibaiella sp.]|nr:T9SS type A sorting domain-containing protein [Taibaiella sp.]
MNAILNNKLYAQSENDLELRVVSPFEGQIFTDGDTVMYTYQIINHGPHELVEGTDLLFIKTSYSDIPSVVTINLDVNDTSMDMSIAYFVVGPSTPNGLYDICIYLDSDNSSYIETNQLNDTSCVQFGIDFPTSVNSSEDYDFKVNVYPNPAHNHIYFDTKDLKIESVEIYDLSGRINTGRHILNQNRIDISLFDSGLYFIRINTDRGIFFDKFLKL